MKNEISKNKKINGIMLASIIGALVVLGGFTSYAFFQASGTKENEKVSVEAGNMELIFSDGSPGFSKELEFGGSAEKTFTIKNNGTVDTIAKINWKNLTNTYLEESLTYSLNYTDEENNTKEVITNENIPRSETPTTVELANGITIPAGKTYTITLTITLNYLESTDQTADLNARFSSEFSIEEGAIPNLVKVLLSKTNDATITDYNSGNKGEMFTFSHDATEQTEALTDYRYIGDIPNNYIQFNDETWRIIGVFTVEGENGEKEQSVKIIRDESIGKFSWDNKADKTSTSEWPTSSLATMLNGNYIKSGGNFTYTYYIGPNTMFSPQTAKIKGLNSNSAQQIVSVKWYLSSPTSNASSVNLSASDYYIFERGTTTCATTGRCSGGTRSINSFGKVGLMYPSDYLYTFALGVDNACFQNGYNCQISSGGSPINSWLYNDANSLLTISPNANSGNGALMILSGGYVNGGNLYNGAIVMPSAFLKSDIQIDSGNGSKQNPYILKETVE